MSATLVLVNGRIHTQDPANPLVTAVAIRDDKILAIGTDDAMKALLGADGELINLNGRTVTPGLVDAHVHFQWFALGLQRVNLDGSRNLADALSRIEDHIIANPPATPDEWLEGHGWAQDSWPERAFPTAQQLDKLLPNRPAMLRHKSGHAAWVNSYALKVAGITAETPDPPGGEIQRDENGRPTGILFEEAINLVSEHIPRPTTSQIANAMLAAQSYCWQAGLTGIHDFDGRSSFLALQQLHQNRQLGLRIVKNIPVYRLEHAIGVGLRTGFGDHWLRIGGVKIFADGALGPRTAAMLAPYENDPDNTGIIVTDKEEMIEKATQASANGLSVTIHAIGDRANHDVLDVYETVRQQEKRRGDTSLRHRIEHVQILHPNDIPRLNQLNIIASMQPIHATSDMEMADRYWGVRAQYSYAWRTVLETGALVVFGSDAPIEAIDPIPGIHAAVTRRRADGSPGPNGWYPEQRLTLSEAIYAFTMAAALTSGQEKQLGSITPGKLADLTIFDRDIFSIPLHELQHIQIAGTIVGGEFKYRNID